MAAFILFVILSSLGLRCAENVSVQNDMKSALEDLLQKLDSIQRTVTARDEQMFDKLNKSIDSLEMDLMGRVEEVVKQVVQNRSDSDQDLLGEMSLIENQVISTCGNNSDKNEKEIAYLKEQVKYLWNTSGCVKTCKTCDKLSICPTCTDAECSTSTAVPLSSTTTTTTPLPPEDITFLLVPLWSIYYHHLRNITFKDKISQTGRRRTKTTIRKYEVSYDEYDSAACAPDRDQVFVSTYLPYQIIQVNGNGRDTKLIKEGIKSMGMTVDNIRNLIFLTSSYPHNAIYSMTFEGKDITEILGTAKFQMSPKAIAVNPETQVIYASDDTYLFSVNYDGSDYLELFTGAYIYGITVDVGNNVLYFNSRNRIYKMNMKTYASDAIISVEFIVYNLEYYADKLYFTASNDPIVGVIDLNNDPPSVIYKRRFRFKGVHGLAICPKL